MEQRKSLEIDFRLPYARVLADEESQKEDNAEVGAAIRMALLLLTVEGLKAEDLKSEDLKEVRTSVWVGEDGVGYSMVDGEGNVVESGDDWSGLVRRLESVLPEGEESLSIIWP